MNVENIDKVIAYIDSDLFTRVYAWGSFRQCMCGIAGRALDENIYHSVDLATAFGITEKVARDIVLMENDGHDAYRDENSFSSFAPFERLDREAQQILLITALTDMKSTGKFVWPDIA